MDLDALIFLRDINLPSTYLVPAVGEYSNATPLLPQERRLYLQICELK